jgi:peptidoglycan/xylan/chitin deacetylase (PgdA/CDA1 family)
MLRVLMFHRIADPGDRSLLNPGLVSATPVVFERIMDWLARRYSVVSLAEAVDGVAGRRALPRRAVLLTFDDAYRDFAGTAWPILMRYGLPATLFVPTASVDRLWRRCGVVRRGEGEAQTTL